MPTSADDRNEEFFDGLPADTKADADRRFWTRMGGPVAKGWSRTVMPVPAVDVIGMLERAGVVVDRMRYHLREHPAALARWEDDGGPAYEPPVEPGNHGEREQALLSSKHVGIVVASRQVGKTQMREDAFHRLLIPPVPITNNELDRSIPTRPTREQYKDNPEGFVRHARMYNRMAANTWLDHIPEAEIDEVEKAVLAKQLSRVLTLQPPHDDFECGFVTREMMEQVIKGTADGKFAQVSYLGTPKSQDNTLERLWQESTGVVERPPEQVFSFAAHETLGMAVAHVMPVTKVTREDNPEMFAELDAMIADGRATIDEHGGLTFKDDEADEPIIVEATDGTAQLERRVAEPQQPAELPPR